MKTSLHSLRQPDVVSFDPAGFEDACADLMRQVQADFRPDALIAVPTGGLHVAEAMARSAGGRLPVLSMTCRRASTAAKNRLAGLKALAARLPRPVADRLRVFEHALLTQRTRPAPAAPYIFDPQELSRLRAWLSGARGRASLLIVDDAVDSGVTLHHVLEAVRGLAPSTAVIRSAVITVTTPRPLAQPHYALHQGQLCRFPWSLDA
jgi:hypoxanthine phosphoribosyltransferase